MLNQDKQIWDQHLEPDETLLWQGQPQAGLRFTPSGEKRLIMGGAFTLIGGFMVWNGPDQMSFDTIGLYSFYAVSYFIMLFGLYWLILDWFVDAWQRARTSYAITSGRALVLNKTLNAYPITKSSPVALWDRAPDSVIFAETHITARAITTVKIGFHALDDPAHVLAVLASVKSKATQ